jgi:TRAP transporter 4TM/12TM fusion protein
MAETDKRGPGTPGPVTADLPADPDAPGITAPHVKIIGAALGAILTCGSIAEALDLYQLAGIAGFIEQRLIAMLGIALVLAFAVFPAKPKAARPHIPWYDWIAIAVSAGVCFYVTWQYAIIFDNLHARPPEVVASAVMIVLLVAEGLRRTAGKVLFIFMSFFILFGLYGHYVPGQFEGRDVDIDRMFLYIALDPNGLVGIPMVVSTTIVITFVFFGHLLEASGGSKFFTDISVALMGRYRGGSSKIAISASCLFGSISGSAVSNVVSTGVITIPMMKRGGYPAHVAGAIEAVASTGGQLMPPIMGAAAFVMAEFLQVPYGDVVIAAIIPALLYYITLFIQADLYAERHGISRVEEELIPARGRVFRAGWPFLLPFAVLIAALFNLNLRPDTSALAAALAAVIVGIGIGYDGARMAVKSVFRAFSTTGIAVTQIVMIGAMAGIVIGVLNITGLGFALTQALIEIAAGNLFLLLVMAAIVSIILGMGMPTLGVYLLLATLVAPSLIEVGVPAMAAHLFALYFGMLSMITPPVAIAAFAAATVANTNPMRTGYAAVLFGWSAYVIPFLFVVSPALLLNGSATAILAAAAAAIAGIWAVSVGLAGHLFAPLGTAMRAGYIAAGIALLVPAAVIDGAAFVNLAGGAVAAGLTFLGKRQRAGELSGGGS